MPGSTCCRRIEHESGNHRFKFPDSSVFRNSAENLCRRCRRRQALPSYRATPQSPAGDSSPFRGALIAPQTSPGKHFDPLSESGHRSGIPRMYRCRQAACGEQTERNIQIHPLRSRSEGDAFMYSPQGRQGRQMFSGEARKTGEFGNSNLWFPKSCQNRRQQVSVGTADRREHRLQAQSADRSMVSRPTQMVAPGTNSEGARSGFRRRSRPSLMRNFCVTVANDSPGVRV